MKGDIVIMEKTFDDFLNTLTPEKIKSIENEILTNREPKQANLATVDISFSVALKLLNLYHDWLNQ